MNLPAFSDALSSPPQVAVLGGGPAGLMAAEALAHAGARVTVFESRPSVGRKFLLAGRGGLNLTHSEPLAPFLARYAEREAELTPVVQAFGPQALRDWAARHGIETFIGSSGRVFPRDMKAAPLLRAWLHRLRGAGVVFHTRHRWLGWADDGALRFQGPQGEVAHRVDATLLALGGGSWPALGSDGAWVPWLLARGVDIAPLRPANCGFDLAAASGLAPGWSDFLRDRFAGQPVKPVAAWVSSSQGVTPRQQGEFVLTATGVEGSLIYALSAPLRHAIEQEGSATLHLDLLPDHPAAQVLIETTRARGPRSLATHLKSRLGIHGLKLALLHESLGPAGMNDPQRLAAALKDLPLTLGATRPLAEAISTAGGVRFEALHPQFNFMLRAAPGVFCAGEMLDWEAPTGGYLLTACMATGRAAGLSVMDWWAHREPA